MSLLKVRNLQVSFISQGEEFCAVRGLSFSVHHGETLCLVGESGSGKSLTALAIMGLLPETALMQGEILFDNQVVAADRALHRGHRFCGRGMAMIFQEPAGSLNPSMRVEQLVGEAWRIRHSASRSLTRERVRKALADAEVRNPDELLGLYPWQLSGGLAQRVMIASALILSPKLLIADEPTTALDVTTQARILRLLSRLQKERNLALLFITHDLAVAGLMGGRTMVMSQGELVECGATSQVLSAPQHPFTRVLINATPAYALAQGRRRLSM